MKWRDGLGCSPMEHQRGQQKGSVEDGEGFAVNAVNFKVDAVYALEVFGRHHFVNGSLCGDPTILKAQITSE